MVIEKGSISDPIHLHQRHVFSLDLLEHVKRYIYEQFSEKTRNQFYKVIIIISSI